MAGIPGDAGAGAEGSVGGQGVAHGYPPHREKGLETLYILAEMRGSPGARHSPQNKMNSSRLVPPAPHNLRPCRHTVATFYKSTCRNPAVAV